MQTIVVATDLSNRSTTAIDRGQAFAAETGAKLVLVHAVDDDQPDDIVAAEIARGEQHLALELARRRDPPFSIEVVTGDTFIAVVECVRKQNADLLICGDHRRGFLRDVFRDTTVERIVRLTTVPVLIARKQLTKPYETAVIGLEANEIATAIPILEQLAAWLPKNIVAVHAVDPAEVGLMFAGGIDRDRIAEYRNQIVEESRARILEDMDPRLRERVRLRVIYGSPVSALEAESSLNNADLIVTASHARRAIGRSVLGSVTGELLRHGTTDLLILPRD
jgi:nucleotide-binding universal stress UspA family protein